MRLANLESRVFFALLLATTFFFLWMVRGFLLPVFWAAVFAVLFQPLYERLLTRMRGRKNSAALAATVIVILVVVVPFGLLVAAVTQQALALYARVESGQVDLDAPLAFVERSLPAITRFLEGYGVRVEQLRTGIENGAVAATQYIASRALALGQNALLTTILFALMLYLLYFFFRDGARIIESLVRTLPMGDERERRLMERFAQVSRATVKGTLVVAGTQGALGGIMFALIGIQAALFWGVIMGILSLLPAVGPALVWIPAAAILLATGKIWQGLVVIAGGTLVIGLVDNLLRPTLVGRQAQMPDYLVLIATLGGIAAFGLAGFVAGPIVAALFLVMWDMFADEYAPLDSDAPPAAVAAAVDQPVANSPSGSAPSTLAPAVITRAAAPEDGTAADPRASSAALESHRADDSAREGG